MISVIFTLLIGGLFSKSFAADPSTTSSAPATTVTVFSNDPNTLAENQRILDEQRHMFFIRLGFIGVAILVILLVFGAIGFYQARRKRQQEHNQKLNNTGLDPLPAYDSNDYTKLSQVQNQSTYPFVIAAPPPVAHEPLASTILPSYAYNDLGQQVPSQAYDGSKANFKTVNIDMEKQK